MQKLRVEEEVGNLISPIMMANELGIVRVKMLEGAQRKVLQIMIEKENGDNVNVDDCANASREISLILDVNEVISGEYDLEVSSAGLARPLVEFEDFKKFSNQKIVFRLRFLHQELRKKKIIGVITKIFDENQEFEVETIDSNAKKLLIKYGELTAANIHVDGDLF